MSPTQLGHTCNASSVPTCQQPSLVLHTSAQRALLSILSLAERGFMSTDHGMSGSMSSARVPKMFALAHYNGIPFIH